MGQSRNLGQLVDVYRADGLASLELAFRELMMSEDPFAGDVDVVPRVEIDLVFPIVALVFDLGSRQLVA